MVQKDSLLQTYELGQRVVTVYGEGVVLGFESFTPEGHQAPTSRKDNGRRIIVKLDDPTKWSCSPISHNPYFYRQDVSAH